MKPKGWILSKELTRALDKWTADWHGTRGPGRGTGKGMRSLVRLVHYYNFSLWHEEDEARRRNVPDKMIAQNKRNIDRFNQLRNDSIEKLDDWLLGVNPQLAARAAKGKKPGIRQNSETPGSMVDRISIATLKLYHMSIEAKRRSATAADRSAAREKAGRVGLQRSALGQCYDEFMDDFRAGIRYFNTYRQLKMYNDPKLNPELYGK